MPTIRGELLSKYSSNEMSLEEAEWNVEKDLEVLASLGNEEAQQALGG